MGILIAVLIAVGLELRTMPGSVQPQDKCVEWGRQYLAKAQWEKQYWARIALKTDCPPSSPIFPGGSQMAAIWEWWLSMGTGAADMKCVLPGKCKCVEGWDKTWNSSCAYCKNVGHYTPSTLVRILGRDSCLRTTRWIRAEALNLDGLYSNVCSTKSMTGDKFWIFLFLLVRIKIVPPLWEVVNT